MQIQNSNSSTFRSIYKMRVFVNNEKSINKNVIKEGYKQLAISLVGPSFKPSRVETAKAYALLDTKDYGYERIKNGIVMDKHFMYENTDNKASSLFKMIWDKNKNIHYFLSGDEANDIEILDRKIADCIAYDNVNSAVTFSKQKNSLIHKILKDYKNNVKKDANSAKCIDIYLTSNVPKNAFKPYSYALNGIKIRPMDKGEINISL